MREGGRVEILSCLWALVIPRLRNDNFESASVRFVAGCGILYGAIGQGTTMSCGRRFKRLELLANVPLWRRRARCWRPLTLVEVTITFKRTPLITQYVETRGARRRDWKDEVRLRVSLVCRPHGRSGMCQYTQAPSTTCIAAPRSKTRGAVKQVSETAIVPQVYPSIVADVCDCELAAFSPCRTSIRNNIPLFGLGVPLALVQGLVFVRPPLRQWYKRTR